MHFANALLPAILLLGMDWYHDAMPYLTMKSDILLCCYLFADSAESLHFMMPPLTMHLCWVFDR